MTTPILTLVWMMVNGHSSECPPELVEMARRGAAYYAMSGESSEKILASKEHSRSFQDLIELTRWLRLDNRTLFETVARELPNPGFQETLIPILNEANLAERLHPLFFEILRTIRNREEKIKYRPERFHQWSNSVKATDSQTHLHSMVGPDLKKIMEGISSPCGSEEDLRIIIAKHRVSKPGLGGKVYVRSLMEAIRFQLYPPLDPQNLLEDCKRTVFGLVYRCFGALIEKRAVAKNGLAEEEVSLQKEDHLDEDLLRFRIVTYSFADTYGLSILAWLDDLPTDERQSVYRLCQRAMNGEIEGLLHARHLVRLGGYEVWELRPNGGISPNRLFLGLEGKRPFFIFGGRVKDGSNCQNRLAERANTIWKTHKRP